MGPLVALVSAAMTTPPLYRHPTMVVPVLVALGSGTPFACKMLFLLWLLKSKPGIVAVVGLGQGSLVLSSEGEGSCSVCEMRGRVMVMVM